MVIAMDLVASESCVNSSYKSYCFCCLACCHYHFFYGSKYLTFGYLDPEGLLLRVTITTDECWTSFSLEALYIVLWDPGPPNVL